MRKLIITVFLALSINNGYAKEIIMENQNEAFAQFADQLIKDEKNPTFDREFLNPQDLDYTFHSLHSICAFLIDADKKELHLRPYEDIVRLALRTGAYVGETIRKNFKNITWNWVEYDEAIKFHPEIAQYQEKSLGTRFLMIGTVTDKEGTIAYFSFPVTKVLKNLENGEEDSVYAFAVSQIVIQDEMENAINDSKNLK